MVMLLSIKHEGRVQLGEVFDCIPEKYLGKFYVFISQLATYVDSVLDFNV